ncbi:CBO0543 family protein [Metabacillus bambusae]|uniref:Uncharacterized protein n=1 Tax=Metabacillus bambusae TaxID=2795218 RepID=A0ABS3NBQ1_9BACI|nr:CBO0543 family protein [Metabacillus bambusae]MBO1515585.1 hypothetical protein [Metabacillus bambusae]
MNDKFEHMWKVQELQNKAVKLDIQGWLKDEVFTWNWWVLLALLIIPWLIWFKYADRRRMLEILLFGALVVIITTSLDTVGNEIGLWVYPTQLIPLSNEAIEFDHSIVAVGFMLLYQYFRTWKTFVIALIFMAAIFSFIGEPLCHLLEAVLYIKWSYFYSFVYYITIGILIKAIVGKLKRMYVQ